LSKLKTYDVEDDYGTAFDEIQKSRSKIRECSYQELSLRRLQRSCSLQLQGLFSGRAKTYHICSMSKGKSRHKDLQ
jgi:hypothetical protein